MKTLTQYETQIKDESLNLEDYINESRIDEGFLSALKEFIKGGTSLFAKMFKHSKKAGSDVLKFYKQKSKERADNNTLKSFSSGREFWDNWFAKSKWEKPWLEINPKEDAKESLENNHKLITEATSSEERETNKQKGAAMQAEADKKNQVDFAFFSEEKYEKYAKYEGMIDIIIAGFTFVYDLAKSKNDKKALELVSGYIKNALKDKSVSSEQKSHLKEAINDVKDASEKTNKEEEQLDPIKTFADKHKATLQDLAKMGNLDNKVLTGIEAKVKKALESLKDNNDIINESDELKVKLSKSETAQSLFSTILVAYYGLKNLKIVSTPEDLIGWIKLIEDTKVD